MSAIAEAGAPPLATTSSPSLPQMARAEEAAAQPRPQRRRPAPPPPPLLLLLLLASAVLGGGRALQSSPPPPPAGRLRSGGVGSGTSAAGAGGAGAGGADGPLLVVDLYNALGHTGFGLGPEALVLRAAAWRSSRRRRGGDGSAEGKGTERGAGMAEVPPLCFVVDHGSSRSSHAGGPLPPGIGMTFAGPGGLTADDVIVGLVRERFGGGGEEGGGAAPARNSTVVVTADAGLIGRCRRQAREAAGGSWAGSGGRTGTGTGTGTAEDGLAFVEPMSFLRELEAHSHADGSLFGRDVAVEVLSTPREEKAEKGAEVGQEDGARGEAAPPAGAGESERGGEGLAAELASAESAIERTLRARRRLVKDRRGKKRARAGRAGRSSSSSRAASRSQRARAATDARRGEAERLREGLVRAGTVHTDEAPVRALLGWLLEVEEEEEAGGAKWTGAAADGGDGPLGLGLDGGRDPLGCVVRVPRRGGGAGGSLAEGGSDTVRLVVISDTHGFEAALGALPSPEDPAAGAGGGASGGGGREGGPHLLPDADILVHCGDFAANGSRARQRESVRKLDAFLADQAHIPHKVVVMGNHDPKIPGRTLFPKSGAVYATTARRLRLGGLRMAVEPFSRRSYARIAQATENVSNADVLISHEPPHGTLDLTYSGTRAGSRALREAVVSAETKPRAWLCGHIHEGRGLAREMFDRGESECAPTLVVNAANANVGKARRLVTGAVLIDIEREDRGEGGRERDGAGADAWDQLVQLDTKRDLGLDPIHVRPGVRRRKGVPSSSRSRQRRK